MKRLLSAAGALVVTLTFSAGDAKAQTVANGTYYAAPSWNLTLPASSRFIVLANFNQEAVLDRETGLVWERTPALVSLTWGVAHTACMLKHVGGRSGWRLPNIHELGSLVGADRMLPAGHPFAVDIGATFVSSTETPLNTGLLAMAKPFDGGGLVAVLQTSLSRYWCVRGGSIDAR